MSPAINTQAVPDGWRLVPVEPTPKQIGDGIRALMDAPDLGGIVEPYLPEVVDAYKAMLTSAPPAPPAPSVGGQDHIADASKMVADTTRPDGVLAAYAEGRIHHLNRGLCPDEVAGHSSRDPDCPVCAALTAPASKPSSHGCHWKACPHGSECVHAKPAGIEVEQRQVLYGGIIRAAINLLAACQERHDTQPAPQCYGVPYGAVNALRDALEGHAKPAEGGVVERRALIEAHNAIEELLAWDARRNFPVPYKVRDPLLAALGSARAALAREGSA